MGSNKNVSLYLPFKNKKPIILLIPLIKEDIEW